MNKLFPFIAQLLFWVGIAGSVTVTARAQQPYARHLTDQNGLPSQTIFSILQDRKGYIWLSSNEGLYRYDSKKFKRFTSSLQTSYSGSCIQEDRYGRIWYENFDGFLYYVQNDEMHALKQQTPPGYSTFGLTDRYLYVIQKKGIDVYDLKTLQRIKTFPLNVEEAESTTVLGNNFYCIIDHRLYRIDENLQLHTSAYFVAKNLKFKFIYPYKDRLYVVSKLNEEKQLYFFDQQLQFIQQVPIGPIEFVQGSTVIEDTIWIHSSKGSYAYTATGKPVLTTPIDPESSHSKVLKDRENRYWFTSVNNGIKLISQLNDLYFPLANYKLTRFDQTATGYLIGTADGKLLAVDKHFQKPTLKRDIAENLPTLYIYNDSISKITTVADNGFSLIQNQAFNHPLSYRIALKEAVRVDEKYYAFAASGYYGLLLNPTASPLQTSVWDSLFRAHVHPEVPTVARLKSGLRAKSIVFDPKRQQLYIATNTGLHVQTPRTYKELLNDRNFPVYSNRLVYFNESLYLLDTKGNLYVKAENNAVIPWDSALQLEAGEVKMLKNLGPQLAIVTPQQIHLYRQTNGKSEITSFAIDHKSVRDLLVTDQKLLILQEDGILALNINASRKHTPPSLFIEHIKVNQRDVKSDALTQLRFNENNLEVHFALLDFDELPATLAYRMNQNEWIPLHQDTRKLQFPSLSAGEYTLEFSVNGEIQKEKLQFNIATAFWERWWFYAIVVVASCGLIYAYFNWQYRLMQNQIRLLNEKVELEKNLGKSMLASIKSQMNPHFFYNALNTIQAYIFTNDKERANTYLAKFSKLTRLILEMSEKETISLREEIDALHLYLSLEQMRFTSQMHYKLNYTSVADQLDTIELPPMLIQPFVENAIKHGLLHQKGEKWVHLQFETQGDFLQVTIDDNGIGRKRANELNQIKKNKTPSFALAANEKRLEILNQMTKDKADIGLQITDKYDENGWAMGTTVQLMLPLNP